MSSRDPVAFGCNLTHVTSYCNAITFLCNAVVIALLIIIPSNANVIQLLFKSNLYDKFQIFYNILVYKLK